MDSLYFFTLSFALLCFFSKISIAADTLIPSRSISGGETLVSQGGFFELGFFSPGNSKNRYLGIWYKRIPVRTVVWVANRENPLTNSSGILKIDDKGNLVLVNRTESVIWSSNSSKAAENPVMQLLESGNLVLRDEKDGNSESYVWQSFDYPSDTMLPGMKLGWDLKKGLNRRLSSWKSADDPSPGGLTYGIENEGYPEAVTREDMVKRYRSGPWNGIRFSGAPELRPNPVFWFSLISNENEVYYTYELYNKLILSRLVLNESNGGVRQRFTWTESHGWQVFLSVPRDLCDTYRLCGAYGTCEQHETTNCQCPKGFKPRLLEAWNSMDWSGGCIRKVPLDCEKGDGFVKYTELKLPDTTHAWANKSMSLKECKRECLNNCNCTAYTNSDISGRGSGCAMWFGDLIDIRQIRGAGQDLYIRMAASELAKEDESMKRVIMIIVGIVVASGALLVGWFIWKSKKKPKAHRKNNIYEDYKHEIGEEDLDLPSYDLITITTATNNFSFENKIGEGGFGPVYKGKLSTGQEIAVKRLSEDSVQGLREFKNEVILIAKLQHRNLVRLLGCCIQRGETMLVYEYMPNKSLDFFIFGQTRGTSLNWRKRFDIIVGIARGLLYLHRDSRLRIIHRDLKASNVLLDNDMNPKISDFGTARMFGGDQTEANTKRVIGTYGYMSPEYAIDGHFSMKSDVFSFGVLLLEIVSGKKNRGFYHPDHDLNLLGHAWKLWSEGKPLELMDAMIEDPVPVAEALRCIQVGLLCVQQHPRDRLMMSSVLLMLDSESAVLPQPKQPGFYIERFLGETDLSSSREKSYTENEITVTMLDGR